MTSTARVRVSNVQDAGDGQKVVSFFAPYSDGDGNRINEDWAKYTPALSMSVTLTDEAAGRPEFQMGADVTLTFAPGWGDAGDEADEDGEDGALEDAAAADEATEADDEGADDERQYTA